MKTQFQLTTVIPLLYVMLLQLSTVLSFGASLFGNQFLYRAQRYKTVPHFAYRLRKPYEQKYGPFGDNFIQTLGNFPLFSQPVTSKPFVIAPFGTEGFTLSPEEEEIRKRRKERMEQKRRIRGHRPDKRP